MPLHSAQPLHTLGDYLSSALGAPVSVSQVATSPPTVHVWLKTARTEWRLTQQFARRERVNGPATGKRHVGSVQITATAARPGGVLTVSASFVRKGPQQREAHPISSVYTALADGIHPRMSQSALPRTALTVYTAQRGHYHGRDGLNLTPTSARGLAQAFVPADPDMFTQAHAGTVSLEDFRTWYLQAMRHSYRRHQARWLLVLRRSRVVLLCTCPPGTALCHRYLLADILGKLGAQLGGEIRATPDARLQGTVSHLRTSARPAR